MTGREAIEMIAKSVTMPAGRLCTVQSVDTTDNTAIVNPIDDQDQEITVRIQADKQNGFFIRPSIGSIVGIIMDSDHTGEIVCFSQADLIQMLDGSFGGLTKTQELKTQIDKLNAQLQAVINSLTNWAVIPSDGGAALKTYFATQISGKTAGDFSNIENTHITHGNP